MTSSQSSTYKRRKPFYPTPQNAERLKKATTCEDGSKKEGLSTNKIINEALNMFFKAKGTNFML